MGFYADRVFPWLMDTTDPPELAEQRALTLRGVGGDVLEIGLGTGLSLPHYPDEVRTLSAVEPTGGMHPRALRRAAEAGLTLDLATVAGERLPFEDGRFDAVVITLVLCTAGDVAGVLAEAHRVLRPGGRYHFLEHVRSEEPRVVGWQRRVNGAHKVLACGCDLTRDTERAIRESRFTVESLEHATMPGFNALYPLIRGVATKPT